MANNIFRKWGKSLDIFISGNLGLFLSKTIKTSFDSFKTVVKNFWWLLLTSFVIFILIFGTLGSNIFEILLSKAKQVQVGNSILKINISDSSLKTLNFYSNYFSLGKATTIILIILLFISVLFILYTIYLSVKPIPEKKNMSYFTSLTSKFGKFILLLTISNVLLSLAGAITFKIALIFPSTTFSVLYFMDSVNIGVFALSLKGLKTMMYYLPGILILTFILSLLTTLYILAALLTILIPATLIGFLSHLSAETSANFLQKIFPSFITILILLIPFILLNLSCLQISFWSTYYNSLDLGKQEYDK